MKRQSLKSDKFKKARGGPSRLLKILCAKCNTKICSYQKDGAGMLKRMYLDRMIQPAQNIGLKMLTCPGCDATLGTSMIYKKENRPAYKLYPGAVAKQLTN